MLKVSENISRQPFNSLVWKMPKSFCLLCIISSTIASPIPAYHQAISSSDSLATKTQTIGLPRISPPGMSAPGFADLDVFNVSSPTPFPFQIQQTPQWGPNDISTIVFGCIASILGVVALWVTFWLGRRRSHEPPSNGMSSSSMYDPTTDITPTEDFDPELSGDDLPLEALPSDRLSETGSLEPSADDGRHDPSEASRTTRHSGAE